MTGEPSRGLVCLGRIVGLQGTNGWLRVHSYTRRREDILDYGYWLLGPQDHLRRVVLESGRPHGRGGLVVKLAGVDDRDAAADEVGSLIRISPEQLPEPEAGEYYWHQLEGLAVETLDGTPLGRVDHLLETGANDVLVLAGERERLLPYSPQVVREVDLEARVIRVDWDPEF